MTFNRKKIDFWQYPFLNKIQPHNRLNLGQGNTPCTKITHKHINTIPKETTIYLKREDKNPNGSFKDRALAYQISLLKQNKEEYCVISSSGNAAISAAAFCRMAKIKAIILISPDIPQNKLSQIVKHNPYLIIKSKKAARLANYINKKYKIPNLRPSKDDNAIAGFETLGWEIHQENNDCDAIFTYITSGASLIGIYNYYYSKNKSVKKHPQLFGIQSGQQTFLAKDLFAQNDISENNKQLAGKNAINKPIRARQIYSILTENYPSSKNKSSYNNPVENRALREKIYNDGLISQTSIGTIYWVNNNDIRKYHKYVPGSSYEGAASLAAACKFAELFPQLKNITCIISGKQHDNAKINIPYIPVANNKEDIDALLSRQKLLEKISKKDIFAISTSPVSALGLESIIPTKIVSFDHHPITPLIEKENIDILTLDKILSKKPKRRSTTTLLRNNTTKNWIKKCSNHPSLLIFKPSASIEKICLKNKWNLLANPAELNRKFENKITFAQICDQLKLPQPKYKIDKLFNIDYQKTQKFFGHEFFIQFPRGFAGSSTFLINKQKDISSLSEQYLNRPCKISQKIDGPTYTLNGCVTKNNGIIIQRPFYQITNIPELNSSPGGTCGNIYSDDLKSIKNLPQLINESKKFGDKLKKNGYRGIFGLDFVVESKSGKHHFIECNPRLTASIPMITKLQIKNNEIPLLLIHILEFFNLDYKLNSKSISKIETNPQIGSQIIFRNIKNKPARPAVHYKNGIYSTNRDKNIYQLKNLVLKASAQFKYERSGKDIIDIKKENEFLILCEPKNKTISAGIEYLRIQSLNS